ncbi:hypothetical protein LPYR103PRE_23200 [Segatella asaccharophila]
MLDLRDPIPTFVWLTEAAVNDVNVLDIMPVEAGSIYLMEKDTLTLEPVQQNPSTGCFLRYPY